MAQWLRLDTPNTEGVGPSLVGELDPTHAGKLGVWAPKVKTPWATTKNQCDQRSK